jgi:hypothetical protein
MDVPSPRASSTGSAASVHEAEPSRGRSRWLISTAVAVTVAARLPLLGLPAWPDEAGFLMVAGGWHLGDASEDRALYGRYWVDRPPVLVTIYGLADRLGGLLALRLLGAVAAAVTVLGVAWIAHSVAGLRAASWAAVTGAALISTPFHWSFMVDGELLASPFVAAGIGCVVAAQGSTGGRERLLCCAGGVLAVAAILIKQNIADVLVFVAVLLPGCLLTRSLTLVRALRQLGAFLVGAAGCGVMVAAWTLAHGTSLGSVYYAMYPFRIDVLAVTRDGSAISWNRLGDLALAALLSGLLLLTIWVTLRGLRPRERNACTSALLAVLAYDVFSVAAGTSYWLHYLLQPVVSVAALSGIGAARGRSVRALSAGAATMACVGWAVLVLSPPQTEEELVGTAIAGASRSGDSIVTLRGRSNIDRAAGLPSPYPYLWVTPAQTLDPGYVELKQLLRGPRAPTWLVTKVRVRRVPAPGSLGAVVVNRYRLMTRICGTSVYLRNDVERQAPLARPRPEATARSRCESVGLLPHLLRELA